MGGIKRRPRFQEMGKVASFGSYCGALFPLQERMRAVGKHTGHGGNIAEQTADSAAELRPEPTGEGGRC